jgi:hypothetical protein
MQLSQKEVELVTRAESSLVRANTGRMIMLVVMLVLFAAMLSGILSPDTFAYISVAIVLLAIYIPQFGGPPYDELVALLIRIRSEVEPHKTDPLIEALTRKP